MHVKRTIAIAAFSMTALVVASCSSGSSAGASGDGGTPSPVSITVGSANFTESEIIGNIYAEALRADGYSVQTKFNIGSREAYIPALKDGSIDLIPDYTGNLLVYLDKGADVASPDVIDKALPAELEKSGLVMYTPAPAEDKDAMVVTQETAAKWNLKSIADLVPHSSDVIIGALPEFQTRPRGLAGLKSAYNLVPKKVVSISDGGGPATVKALVDGTVTVADIFTTSPAISKNHFVVLEDPQNNFPAQNVVPVLSKSKASPKLEKLLNGISAELSTDDLLKLNDQVGGSQKQEPKAAAIAWLKAKGLN